MAALSINAIAENASRLGARLQESLSEHTRDLNISRGTSSEFFETTEERLKNIHHQLDSNSDREKLDAMKRLIAVWFHSSSIKFFAQYAKDDIQESQRFRVLCPSGKERGIEQSRDQEARLHLPTTLRRTGTRFGLTFD
jgi:AP-3 complex subunit beta